MGCTLLQTPQQSPGDLRNAIDRVLDAEPFSDGFWGVHVVDLHDGRTLYGRNETRNFMPASNAKLYTTAAGLDLLGPDYRYETAVYVDGPVEDGTLHGNLIVRGGADPSLGGHYLAESGTWDADVDAERIFRDWADSLRAAGIRQIEGDLVGDDDVIDDVPLGVNWSWDDETYYYSAQLSGLSFHDNVIHLHVTGREPGMPAEITWEPLHTNYVRILNKTHTVDADSGFAWSFRRLRGTNTIEITSRVPAGRTDIREVTVENPTKYFMHVLREVLIRSGISITGKPVDVDERPIKPDYSAPQYRRVAVHHSPSLSDVASIINKPSQNLYADLLMKTLAAEFPRENGDMEPGSAALGIDVAMATFVRAGIDTSAIQLVDGSGLSRLNLVSPIMTTALLAYMWRHDDPAVRDAFYDSLPVAGESGSLRFRLRNGPAAGRVRGKTGTLTFASTLSGYTPVAPDRMLAFSLMSNHHASSGTANVRRAQDAILEILARFQP